MSIIGVGDQETCCLRSVSCDVGVIRLSGRERAKGISLHTYCLNNPESLKKNFQPSRWSIESGNDGDTV